MHPFLQNRKKVVAYIIACIGIAAIYSFAIGFAINMQFWQIVVDTLVSGLLFCAQGIVLWLMLRFVVQLDSNIIFSQLIQIVYALISIILIVGIELLVMFLAFNNSFHLLLPTIPLRAFIVILMFVVLLQYYKSQKRNEALEVISEVQQNISSSEEQADDKSIETIDRITVKSGTKINVVAIEDIIYLKAEGDYVSIVSKTGHWLKEQTMKYFEQHLPQNKFVRIHRSYIVNIEMISRIERYGQQQLLELRNGEKIKISNTGYKLLRESLNL